MEPSKSMSRAIREAEAEAMAYKANRLKRVNDLHARLDDLNDAYMALVREAEALRDTLGEVPITIQRKILTLAVQISYGLQILTRQRNGG